MIKISVPATSANLGSGFDCAGIALNLYNEVYIEQDQPFSVTSLDNTEVPKGKDNLIYQSAKMLYDKFDKPVPDFSIKQTNNIPMERGLGSSAACIVAGLIGANEMMGKPCDTNELLNIAARIEGHPDNVAPAFLGGMAAAAIGEQNLYSARFDIREDISFVAFIPPFPLKTSLARSVMPETIPMKDALFNISRCSLLCSAFALGKYDLLTEATKDAVHQPYRLDLIPGARQLFEISNNLGAYATFISGAGSTILSIIKTNDRNYKAKIEQAINQNEQTKVFKVVPLLSDNVGATVERIDKIQ